MVDDTVETLIGRVAQLFSSADLTFGHGTDNAVDEAAYLVFAVLGLDHDQIPAAYANRVSEADAERVLTLAERRAAERVPVAYLVNQGWFAGRQFYVDERVLIPRSPFAELVEQRFSPWVDGGRALEVLELGTGSGCIAISIALEMPDAQVVAIDLMPAALDVARINAERHGVGDRVRLLESNFFASLRGPTPPTFDLIVSNPPYVDEEEMSGLPAEYRHEPAVALESGMDGLDSTITILHDAADFLNESGVLVVEVGNSQAALTAAFPHVPFVWLEFAYGGSGVFLMTKPDLIEHQAEFAAAAEYRRGG